METRRVQRMEALRSFLEADPADSFSRYALALDLCAEGDTDGAAREFQDILRRDPQYIAAYHQYAQLLAREGEEGRAREVYQLGIAAARETGETHAASEMQDEMDALG